MLLKKGSFDSLNQSGGTKPDNTKPKDKVDWKPMVCSYDSPGESLETTKEDSDAVVPMDVDDKDAEEFDLSGEHDADAILAILLGHLRDLAKEHTGDEQTSDMEVEGEEENAQTQRLKDLWGAFDGAMEAVSPVMGSDPAALALMKSIDDQVKTMCVDPELEGVQSLLGDVACLLDILRPVDVEKLLSLLDNHSEAAQIMEGKDVLLFLGGTGAGKTTSILYLAGTIFEEVEIDGFDHLQPQSFPDEKLEAFHTSHRTSSVTKSTQCFEVQVGDKTVVLCDVPGIGDTEGVEVDISNGLGMIRAIQQAKSVKPVLVLSEKGMGDRFSTVSEILDTITKLLGGQPDAESLQAFAYIFTKYDKKYETRLWKQFTAKKKDVAIVEKGASFLALIDDIIAKTSPTARILTPLDQGAATEVLEHLWNENGGKRLDPTESLSTFVPQASQSRLKLQLGYSVSSVKRSLDGGRFQSAQRTLNLLGRLSVVLPESGGHYKESLELALDYFSRRRDRVSSLISSFKNVVEHKTFTKDLQALQLELQELVGFEMLREACLPNELSVNEIRSRAIQEVAKAVGSHWSQSGDVIDTGAFLRKLDMLLEELSRLRVVEDVFQHDNEAKEALRGCEKMLVAAARNCLPIAESCLQTLPDELECLGLLHGGFIQLRTQLEGHPIEEESRLGMIFVDQKWQALIRGLHERVARSLEAIDTAIAHMREETSRSDPTVIGWCSNEQHVDFLEQLSRASRLCNPVLLERANDATKSFETGVVKYFEHTAGCFEQSLAAKQDLGNLSVDDLFHERDKADQFLAVFNSADAQLRDLRKWSGEIEKQTSTLWPQWCGVLPELLAYSAAVKARLQEVQKEGLAISYEAKVFLERLKSGSEDASSLLQELSDKDCWSKWEEARKRSARLVQPKKETNKSSWTSLTSWLGLRRSAPATEEASSSDRDKPKLETVLVGIITWFQNRVRLASKSMSSVNWSHRGNGSLPGLLLKQKVGSLSLLVVFAGLQQKKCSLCKSIIEAPGLSEDIARGEVGLSQALTAFKDLCGAFLVDKKFREIADVLQKLQHCEPTIHQMQSLGAFKNTSDRQILVRSIMACPTYDGLRTDAIRQALATEGELQRHSFIDEPRLKAGNELDRLDFYKLVLSHLDNAAQGACLATHASDERTHLELQALYENCHQLVLAHTQKLYLRVSEPLSHFPERAADFKEISSAIDNLISISRAFSGAEQTIVDRSRSHIQDAGRILSGRLDSFLSSLSSDENLLRPLLRLKKAATEVIVWRKEINQAIDKLLLNASNKAANSGRFILDVAAQLQKVDGEDASIAQQLLSEHGCFAFAMNAVFNAATAQQDIDYVVGGLNLSKGRQEQLKTMYERFSREYNDIVRSGLQATLGDRMDDFFDSLTSEANVVAADSAMPYEAQLISLTAHVFGFWTVRDAVKMAVVGNATSATGNDDDDMMYLKKPHSAQVVCVWSLLNYKKPNRQELRNKMCELKTGEGKSVVLGVAATSLALLGYQVECVCYSKYLSGRDYNDFREIFLRFGCDDRVFYGTIDDLYEKHIGSVFDLGQDVVLDRRSKCAASGPSDCLRVLLIDEVDVVFKEDFFGNSFNPVVTCHQELLFRLAQFVWSNLNSKDLRADDVYLLQFREVKDFLESFPVDVHPIIKGKIREMVVTAKDVSKGNTDEYLVLDDDVCYKEFDGTTSSTHHGLETMFVYAKECELGNISQTSMKRNINLNIGCGSFSYAELPVIFDAIIGVTGTLAGLRTAEKETLKTMYNIDSFCCIPSVYGANKLQFASDNSRDVILCDSSEEHCFEIAAEIERRSRPVNGLEGARRPVLVFFRDKWALQAFNNSSQVTTLKAKGVVQTITEEVDPSAKEGLFQKATKAGVVSLLIRDFGRGTDFKCFDAKVLAAGGVHVIQAFYSTDYSEFIQMKGRTARQGADGSFSMVLNPRDLRKDLQIRADDIDMMRNQAQRCTFLDRRREKNFKEAHQELLQKVKRAEEMHYRSMAFMEAARNNRRDEALEFLFEMNGVATGRTQAFKRNGLKQKSLEQRRRRIEAHNKRERARRRSEQEAAEDVPTLLLTAEDTTHYGVLGVSRDASKRDIVRAYRRLVLVHHPDKSSDANAATLFMKIQEAKNVLLRDRARAAYDRSLA